MKIPFNKPYLTGKEIENIQRSGSLAQLAGDGYFTKKCHADLQALAEASTALLTHSCTAALEMSALLMDLQAGDEVIMPSYTFVSTANAYALRGATPVFVDVREDTLNIDESLIHNAITAKTKAIVPVHYAGVSCEMDTINRLAADAGVRVIEDAAQGVMSTYKGQYLGGIGDLGAYSFHETKNIISGEGGALLVNDAELSERAEIIREKGTDRSRFFRGQVDKYTWQDIGSSFLPGELIAAFLSAQLDEARQITDQRIALWDNYHCLFESLEASEKVRRPVVPEHCSHNAHMYYLILPRGCDRERVLKRMHDDGVNSVFHYVPLHSSPAGQKIGRVSGEMSNTNDLAARLIRLPLWIGLTADMQLKVKDAVEMALNEVGF